MLGDDTHFKSFCKLQNISSYMQTKVFTFFISKCFEKWLIFKSPVYTETKNNNTYRVPQKKVGFVF